MIRPVHSSLTKPSRGFALVLALIALLIISTVVIAGYLVSSRQLTAGLAGLAANAGLYSAEAGLNASLAVWSSKSAAELRPGSTMQLLSGELASGDAYDVWVTRLDDGSDDRAFFLIRSVGTARGPGGGRRQLGLLVQADQLSDSLCCAAALSSAARVSMESSALVSGDHLGGGEDSACYPSEARPGILLDERSGQLSVQAGSRISGDPPVLRSSDVGRQAEALRLRFLQHRDFTLPAGTVIKHVGPASQADGICQRRRRDNWGAPGTSSHPCSSYLPIVHASGDLTLLSGRGQGILIVDGNLTLQGGFQFDGIILLAGSLDARTPGAGVRGAIIAGREDAVIALGTGARIQYDPCAVRRALWGSNLGALRPLAQRAWLEIFK